MNKTALVIPTIRNLDFLSAWGSQFTDCALIVVEDDFERTVQFSAKQFAQTDHFCWADISRELGDDEWIISRKNAGIRSYGFWKAWQMGADVIVTIDDDCYPVSEGFVERHLQNLNFLAPERWVNTYPDPRWMFTRGMPYGNRNLMPIKVSHGFWSGSAGFGWKNGSCFIGAITREAVSSNETSDTNRVLLSDV
jgi:hypothetical protein